MLNQFNQHGRQTPDLKTMTLEELIKYRQELEKQSLERLKGLAFSPYNFPSQGKTVANVALDLLDSLRNYDNYRFEELAKKENDVLRDCVLLVLDSDRFLSYGPELQRVKDKIAAAVKYRENSVLRASALFDHIQATPSFRT